MLKKIEAATATAVSVDRVKARLSIEANDFDDDIQALLAAAEAALEAQTGLVMSESAWEYRANSWSGYWCGLEWSNWSLDRGFFPAGNALLVPSAPVRDISGVHYLDADNAEQTIDVGDYSWERTTEGAIVTFNSGFVPPQISDRPQSVRVLFHAGYDPAETPNEDDPELTLPPQAEMAILFLVGHWFANREPVNIGNLTTSLPLTFEMLSQQLRVYR